SHRAFAGRYSSSNPSLPLLPSVLLRSDSRAESWKCFLQGSTVRDRNDFGSFSNATNEAGKNFAGSKLQEQITPELINHVFDSLRPPDSPGYLFGQALRDVVLSGYRLGRNISDYCRDRPEDRDAGEVPSQFYLCRNHQPRMERPGNVQWNGPFYPISLREFDCFADVLHFPGQN